MHQYASCYAVYIFVCAMCVGGREESEKQEGHVSELQARCRILETLHGTADPDVIGLAGGLCVKCAQNDAVLPPSVTYTQKRSVERLTRSGLGTPLSYDV